MSLFPGAENLIGKKISHYRVLQLLGGGGMGVVFKAEDLKLGRQVAMKFLPGELASDPAAFERLQREWTMDLEGGKPLMVTTATGESVPELSPDGKWIVFAAIGSEHWTTLWRVNSGGGYPVELNKKQWWRPVTSPDGKWIAGFYADHPIGTQTLPTSMAVIASDGGRPSKIIPIPASVSQSAGIRWSRDSRRLTYVDERTDGNNIFSQSLDDSPPHQITRFQGVDLFSFDWSADGTELAFSRGILTRDVVLIEDAQRK